MNAKTMTRAAAAGLVLILTGVVYARHVTHPVTPQNIDQQPFGLSVIIKDAPPPKAGAPGKGVPATKEVEITVRAKSGGAPNRALHGRLTLNPLGHDSVKSPPVTIKQTDAATIFTFSLAADEALRAYFTLTESGDEPFPSPGDFWIIDLKIFAKK